MEVLYSQLSHALFSPTSSTAVSMFANPCNFDKVEIDIITTQFNFYLTGFCRTKPFAELKKIDVVINDLFKCVFPLSMHKDATYETK